jgi:uncharacterized protein (DUF849 family)
MADKVILSCAVTGSIHVPSISPDHAGTDRPGMPLPPVRPGKSVIFMPTRNGQPTMDLGLFQEFCQKSTRKVTLLSASRRVEPTMTPEERMVAVRRFKPTGIVNMGRSPWSVSDHGEDWNTSLTGRKIPGKTKDNIFKNRSMTRNVSSRS